MRRSPCGPPVSVDLLDQANELLQSQSISAFGIGARAGRRAGWQWCIV